MSFIHGSTLYFPICSGGIEIESGKYKIHTFNTGGTFTVVRAGKVDVLVVAGGGGGSRGGGGNRGGGGGGAGGLIYYTGFTVSVSA